VEENKMIKEVDAFTFEIKRLIGKDPKLANTIVNVFLRHYSINNALVMKESLVKGNITNIPTPFLVEIAKELNVKNYEQYFGENEEIKMGELLSMMGSMETEQLALIRKIEKLEKKVGV
jgi:hypothetical protein